MLLIGCDEAYSFYREWFLRTFQGKVGLAALVSGLPALVIEPVAGRFGLQNEAILWVPAALFAVAFVVLVLFGFGRAPYQMFNELEAERDKLRPAIQS